MTTAATAKVQPRIGGMACGFCVASVSKAIGRMPGVVVNMPLLTWPGGRR